MRRVRSTDLYLVSIRRVIPPPGSPRASAARDASSRFGTRGGHAGGGGAGKGFAGSVALQSHMTNSRLTDPEVLEARYPVRLERFALRSGSGGDGCWRGGDGLERTIRFLEPMSLSLISGSRLVPPFGLDGGTSGASGENQLIRADGTEERLPGLVQLELKAGEAIKMLTPGGGGYGVSA